MEDPRVEASERVSEPIAEPPTEAEECEESSDRLAEEQRAELAEPWEEEPCDEWWEEPCEWDVRDE